MRLCLAITGEERARTLQAALQAGGISWEILRARDGEQALSAVRQNCFDVLILHGCLPKLDGYAVLEALWEMVLPCPPRILMLSEPELLSRDAIRADCVASMLARPAHLARLAELLAQKKAPMLAAGTKALRGRLAQELLSDLGLGKRLKGRAYIAWMLDMLIPAPSLENEITLTLYPSCANAFETTPAAVERCVRHAVEEVFIRGNMDEIERYFGTTVDPERGKPTNRAFLVGAAERLREQMRSGGYALPRALALNSSDSCQSPPAPMSV